MIHEETFQQKLEREIGKKLKLKINDNRSTMLSVKWEPGCTHVSLHRFFLKAPKNVMDSLACYIGGKTDKTWPTVQDFIDKHTKKFDFSSEIDKEKLVVQGKNYNLQRIMQHLNRKYFNNKLKLHITWYGERNKKNKSRVTFGLYDEMYKLIKINRILDSAKYPDYLVKFVIYHEMLHHVCPPYKDTKGKYRIHNKEFKAKEAEFEDFERAEKWFKNNIDQFFSRTI